MRRARLARLRVLLDMTYALRGPSGTGVYVMRLAEALSGAGIDVVEAADTARRVPAGGGLGSARNLAHDLVWTQVELPRQARAAGADVLHHPLPAVSRLAPCPQVVTVHDLAFERLPDCFDPRFRRWASFSHRAAARSAAAVVVPSRTTLLDVTSRWGVAAERVVVAPHGPGQEPGAAREHRGAEHWLYVGDDEPRKNLGVLLAAHARHRRDAGDAALPLVLAGTFRHGLPSAPGLRVVDRPGASALADLYAGAAALVLPSLHEGFGLTALEAMNAGVPVVAARAPGVTETVADAAVSFDPRRSDDLAGVLDRVAADPGLRKDLRERGRRRAGSFSWARSARAHVEAYRLALSGPAGSTDAVGSHG